MVEQGIGYGILVGFGEAASCQADGWSLLTWHVTVERHLDMQHINCRFIHTHTLTTADCR